MNEGSWIVTYTGRKFDVYDINPEEIVIEDIAHALSNLCRFGGHACTFYSVAQHSVHVNEFAPEHLSLAGLLHDASEAYLIDIPRPIKHHPMLRQYRVLESALIKAIMTKFGCYDGYQYIKPYDNMALYWEANHLFPNECEPMVWAGEDPAPNKKFMAWSPQLSKNIFLETFERLTND